MCGGVVAATSLRTWGLVRRKDLELDLLQVNVGLVAKVAFKKKKNLFHKTI